MISGVTGMELIAHTSTAPAPQATPGVRDQPGTGQVGQRTGKRSVSNADRRFQSGFHEPDRLNAGQEDVFQMGLGRAFPAGQVPYRRFLDARKPLPDAGFEAIRKT